MKVELIAYTALEADVLGDTVIEDLGMDLDDNATGLESLIEFGGRGCYKSYRKPNEKTRANRDYIANIIKQKHLSVLEHASVSFYVEGVSRSLTHELIRHRHFSFSQESQRFVKYDESSRPVVHPTLAEDQFLVDSLNDHWRNSIDRYQQAYHRLTQWGYTRKQAAEAAREFLPNASPTSLVVSGNLRAWYEYLPKRNSPSADAQIAKFSRMVLVILKKVAPSVFAEFE
jgi:thymidylate synthase (FAD)